MLYHLFYPLHPYFSAFNVFRYITFRTAYAILTALVISVIMGPVLIRRLKQYHIGETIRSDGPRSHFAKAGTPTMGGILILMALTVPTLLWADLSNRYIWLVLFSTFAFAAIGFLDDYIKVIRGQPAGLRPKYKFLAQVLVAAMVALFLYFYPGQASTSGTRLSVPFFKTINPDLGWFYPFFVLMVLVGTANAVNLTDGLDGLAIGPLIVATFSYMVILYLTGHSQFASYLNLIYVKGAGELAVFCGAVIGASLGFLWFNAYPAEVFMGNVGSLALGGALGTVAIISRQELLLLVVGGIFVIETVSVILQVASYKLTGKRIFRMAPLHHHFEQRGWQEPKVIVRFWIVAIVLALLSLSTLKLR